MRLIDADAFIDFIDAGHYRSPIRPCFSEQDVVDMIKSRPTVEAIPIVHARWVGESDGYADGLPVYDVWRCDECGYTIDDGTDDPDLLPAFCPNCGSNMDGDADG